MSVRIAVLALALAVLTTGCVVSGGYYHPPRPRPTYYPPPAPPSPSIDVGFFYDALAPYGDWYFDIDLGWVWTPYGVEYGWRPYTEGRWLYTDYGWTWVSSWNWGWAPFHYGRWKFLPRRGWVWIPGREWAPAWVAWRYGDGWVGWAPLPPGVRFRAGVGLDLGDARLDVLIDVHWWSFVEERRLVEPRLRVYVVPEPRNVTLVRVTRDVTRYETTRNRVVVHGVDVDRVSRVTGRPVQRYRIREADSREDTGPARIRAGEVFMYHPEVREAGPDRTPPGHQRQERREAGTRPSTIRPAPPAATEPPRTPPDRAQPPAATETPRTPPARTQPPPRPATGADDAQRARLEERLRRERAELEREHRRETERPPQGVSPEELRRRHEQEMKALRERAERERTLREARAKESKEREQKAKDAEQRGEKKSGDASKTRGKKKNERE